MQAGCSKHETTAFSALLPCPEDRPSPSPLEAIRGAGPVGLRGEVAGQVVEDAADAAGMEAGMLGNLGQRFAVALEAQQLVVGGRTKGQHLPPQVVGLHHLVGRGSRATDIPSNSADSMGCSRSRTRWCWRTRSMKRLRVTLTERPAGWPALAKCQPDERKPCSTSTQIDCTTSTESNLARSRACSCRRTTMRR